MPLLKKRPFKRQSPPPGLNPDDEVFYCEATKEVFTDFESFFQRTILCNSLVWSCSVTGKSNLTYDEAVESEQKARKRLGDIPKPLKKSLLWVADHTNRGRIADLADDVYVFSNVRYFVNEIVEGIINEQWCDCKVLKVLPPSQEEIDKDAEEEREEEEKNKKDSGKDTPSKKKAKKSFFPPDHLFKYELQEIEPDNPDDNPSFIIDAEDIRREKGTYTREKNTLFLKNLVELLPDGNLKLVENVRRKYQLEDLKFLDIFAGPEPIFEVSKRGKCGPSSKKATGTLDGWVTGGTSKASEAKKQSQVQKPPKEKVKKQTAEEIAAEMKRMKEQNERFKEEMRLRAEEAKKKKMEDKIKEKERKKEEKRLVTELLAEYKRPREDLECDDLKELPKTLAVHCKLPNHLFGDTLALLEFFHGFSNILEVRDSFSGGINFHDLEKALSESNSPKGDFYEILSFMLQVLFDLQQEEDEEVKLDAKNLANVKIADLDKNILGKNEDIANQIRSATQMARWCMKHQGQPIKNLHMDEYSLTEILRLHLESAGAYRSEKSLLWLYQQRGGFRLSDDPGLQFRMEEPQILEALATKMIYQLSLDEKMKIMHCLMNQILSYATVRDEVDERFNDLMEAKADLKAHITEENKRQRQVEEAERNKRKEEKLQKKEEEMKRQENQNPTPAPAPPPAADGENAENAENAEKAEKKPEVKPKEEAIPPEALMTDRQREAIQSQKDKEEHEKQKKEEIKRSQAYVKEREMRQRISEVANSFGPQCLGRDRAYRRFWKLESCPGLFVEHNDDEVGECLSSPTKLDPNARVMDEALAIEKVKEILDAREKSSEAGNQSSDKENELEESKTKEITKTYSKKPAVTALAPKQQTVLATMNGSLQQMKQESSENGVLPAGSASDAEVKKDLKPLVNGEVVTKSEAEVCKTEPMEVDCKIKAEAETETAAPKAWGLCLADMDNCTVHSTILPKTHWSYIGTTEELDKFIDALNPRGVRESELKEKLATEREAIAKDMKKFNFEIEPSLKLEAKDEQVKDDTTNEDINAVVDLAMRDQIMEIEEKIFFGTLGTLKIRDRQAWQQAIQAGGYDKQCDTLNWGGKSMMNTPFESRLMSADGSRDPSRPGSPDRESNRDSGNSFVKRQSEKIRGLASAMLQVSQMLAPKYFKPPLGEDEKEKKKRLKEEEKRKKEAEALPENPDVEVIATKEVLTPQQEWEASLMNSTSYAQLFVHLTTLESSIIWSKSILNTKCRICRRKNDPEHMLLCDECDRGHHLYCLKPKMKSIPKGDWFCQDCKPKERVKSPKKKPRRVFNAPEPEPEPEPEAEPEAEASEDDAEEEDIDEPETNANSSDEEEAASDADDDEEQEQEEPEEETPPRRTKKSKRTVEMPKKAKKSANAMPLPPASSSKKGLSHLLGKRKSAAQASEKIARVTQEETASGNSSAAESANGGNDNDTGPKGERQSTRMRGRDRKTPASESAKQLKEQRLSAESGLSKARAGSTKRQRALDTKLLNMYNPTALEDLLNNMMKHKDGWPFDRPVTRSDCPDYFEIIKRPIDLGTVRTNLLHMKYSCNQEVIADVRQVFQNCFSYNAEEAEEFQCATRLEKYFEKTIRKAGLVDDADDDLENQPLSKKSRKTL